MQVGDYRVEIIPDTEFRLDGGAMFGVVPRNLWAQLCPPDEQNRIRMNMNCVFIDAGSEKILIETGIGVKWPAKQTSLYAIERVRPLGETLRMRTGVTPDEITIVINTHLHFDHAGGNTTLSHTGDRASYLPDNWGPLRESGQLEAKDADYEVIPGLRMETHAGHNRSMQCWRLDAGGKTLFGFSDLVPMRAHVPSAWIMGYDLYPVETLEAKKKLLPQAARENWLCLFYHDPDEPLCRIVEEGRKLTAVPIAMREKEQL